MIPILTPNHHWTCPSCLFEDVTHEARPHSRLHPCKGLHGLIAPMVLKGVQSGLRSSSARTTSATRRSSSTRGDRSCR